MSAISLFGRYAPNKTFWAILFGALAGLFYAALIPTVVGALSSSDALFASENQVIEIFGFEISNPGFAKLFLFLCLSIFVFRVLSEVVLSIVALDIRVKLRGDLYSRISKASIVSVEKVGEAKLIQTLVTDVSAIMAGAQLFPNLLTNIVTLAGMLCYLAFLDYDAFIFVVKAIVIGVITYQVPMHFGSKYFAYAREFRDSQQEAFRGLVHGCKELKLDHEKLAEYRKNVLDVEDINIRDKEKVAYAIFSLASSYGGLLCFFVIGGVAFVMVNYSTIAESSIIPTIMVLLYITSPISILLTFFSQLSVTQVSIRKVEQLYKQLEEEDIDEVSVTVPTWQQLRLSEVEYVHNHSAKAQAGSQLGTHQQSRDSFKVGPVNLTLEKGSVTFIVGGNGSGKSTLCKMLSLHYPLMSGSISLDDFEVNRTSIRSVRQSIYSIYSDYYIFERLLTSSFSEQETHEKITHYLKLFALEHKVAFENGKFSNLKLSDGQRRRLALIVAILEDKDVYVFDEWAADQDPEFKHVFYNDVLKELKAQNKLVIVISHDDRYFDVADKLVYVDNGMIDSRVRAPKIAV